MTGLALDLPGARVRFTDRSRDLRGDEERVRLGAELGVRPVFVHQVHGARVVSAEHAGEEADGVWTAAQGVAPAVLVADCLPIALAGPGGVAMLHGGWRGLVGGIVAAGAQALGGEVSAAAIGPGARACCYEVGDDVAAHFEPEARHGRNLDLAGVARRRLVDAGVHHVEDTGVCTMCDERWFSHRREGSAAGRQAGVAWRT